MPSKMTWHTSHPQRPEISRKTLLMSQKWKHYKSTDLSFSLFNPFKSCFISFQAGKRLNKRVNTINSVWRISASYLHLAWGCCSVAWKVRDRYVQQERAQFVGGIVGVLWWSLAINRTWSTSPMDWCTCPSENRLRKLGLFSMEKEMFYGCLTALSSIWRRPTGKKERDSGSGAVATRQGGTGANWGEI